MFDATTVTDDFRTAIAAAGLPPPDEVIDDGRIHRFSSNGRPRDESGWYLLHTDGVPAGSFGDWRTGLTTSWCSKSSTEMTEAEKQANSDRIKAMQAVRDAEQAQRHQQAATQAEMTLKAATPAPESHPYLLKKGIKPNGTFIDKAGFLLVPMRDADRKLWNVERINPADSKDKKGLFGGRRTGLYFGIGKPSGALVVGEGFATMASIHECTGHAVAVAFNAGNLLPVAQALRTKYPGMEIILAADDDHATDGNPGVTKATEAARAVGGLLAVPNFGADRPDGASDFNDLHQIVGADGVAACIKAAQPVNSASTPKAGATFPPLPDGGAEEAPDAHRNAPRPHEDCLYGLVGDVARAASKANREVNEHAAALAFITVLAAGLGRGCYTSIGDDWHHPRLFALHVGRSGRGRKGTSTKLATRILRDLKERHPDVGFQSHTGGLSSREGLVMMIHDGFKVGKNEVEPIHDKRLWILESEFANTLHQTGREGNTLSAALRDAWDGTSIKPATKTAPVYASKPHINVLGHITPSELLELMKARELSNGFANRFLMIWAEQSALDPIPSYTPKETVAELADRMADVLRFAQADRFADGDHARVQLSHEARERYKTLYRGELQDRSGGERVTGLLVRRAAYLLRLATLFALTDKSTVIELQHLEVASHWVRYWVDSVRFIFASAAEEATAEKVQATAERVLAHLDTVGEATRTELVNDCFKRHISKDELDGAISELLTTSPPAIEVQTRARSNGAGSSTKVYRKTPAKSANSANCGAGAGAAAESEAARSLRTLRIVGNEGEVKSPDFAHFADFASGANSGNAQAGGQTSHTSQTSHGDSVVLVAGDDVEEF